MLVKAQKSEKCWVTPLRRSTGGLRCCQPSVHGRTDSLPPPSSLPPSLPIHPPSLLPSTSPPARLPQLTPWLTFLDTLPLPQVLTLTKLPPANTSLDSPLTDISSTPWLPLFDTPPIHKKSSQSYPPNLFSPLSFYPPILLPSLTNIPSLEGHSALQLIPCWHLDFTLFKIPHVHLTLT